MFAIVLSDVRANRNELVGWKATVYPVDGYDRCDGCQDHSKPALGCQYVESQIHKDPKDAIDEVARIAARRAERREGSEVFHVPHEEVQKFAEQIA